MEKIRIDKWLWAVRIYKTRNQAIEMCKKGMVKILDAKVKPSREIRIDEIITIKKSPIYRTYKVLALTDKRMSAKYVTDYVEDITSQDQINLLNEIKKYSFEYRNKGMGRPTKYNRRLIEKLKQMS